MLIRPFVFTFSFLQGNFDIQDLASSLSDLSEQLSQDSTSFGSATVVGNNLVLNISGTTGYVRVFVDANDVSGSSSFSIVGADDAGNE